MWGFSHKKVSMGVAIAPARPLLAPSLQISINISIHLFRLSSNLKSSCRKVSPVFKSRRVYIQIANLNNNVRLATQPTL
jgi:hypothetical protein